MRRVIFKCKLASTQYWLNAEGWFHQWAAKCDDGSENFGNFTVAIVEDDDGKVHEVFPSDVEFITPYTTELNGKKSTRE